MKHAWRTQFGLSVVLVGVLLTSPLNAGLFKMDFGEMQNFEDVEWDIFPEFWFDDEEEFPLTDWSGGGDNDVTLFVMDSEDGDGIGFTPNNLGPPGIELEYDGILVPADVNDDYLYRNPDTAGTSARFRFSNLDPGQYNVTIFEGRTTDANGQYAKLWVESDPNGGGEPNGQNTGNFAAGVQMFSFTISPGDYLWYTHLEDGSGGLSGMIIRRTGSDTEPGDFDGNGTLDVADIDLLTAEVIAGTHTASLDLNGDGTVDRADRTVWVKELKNTWIGDANLDGEFSTADFVLVFQAGKFEQDVPASWGEGDWNGDQRFNSTDFVTAFQDGGFENGPRASLAAVPEPTGVVLLGMGILISLCRRRVGN